ncbi:MAG: hypothetical protein M3Y59_03955 [Myxococcota bacterium]|nr:hypothetical protein [Myxococcota bacterium]
MAIRNDPNLTPALGTPAPTSTSGESRPQDGAKLPRTGEGARALASGARFELWGQDAGGGAKLEARKLDSDRIEVALDGSKKGDKKVFVLDLKNPSAQRAFEDLVRFRATKAELMATTPKTTGVVEGGAPNVVAPQPPAANKVKVSGGANQQTTTDEAGTKERARTLSGSIGSDGGSQLKVTGKQTTQTGAGGRSDTLSLGADGKLQASKTSGETTFQGTVAGTGSYSHTTLKDPNGVKLGTVTDKNGSLTVGGSVKDTTGPDQFSASASHQISGGIKQETSAAGKTTTHSHGSQTQVAVSGQTQQGEVVASAQAGGERSNQVVQIRDAKGGVFTTTTQTQAGSLSGGVKDQAGPDGFRANAGLEQSKTTVTTQGPDGQTVNTTTNGKGTLGGGVNRGGTQVGVDLVRQWQEVSGRDGNGLRTQTGKLTHELELTTAFKGERKVGFERDTAKEYALTLPSTSTGNPALPTTAGTALALPEGATFSLKSTGKMAIAGEADGFSAGISGARAVEIKIARGSGAIVNAVVDFTGKSQNSQGFDRTFGDEKGVAVTVGVSRSADKIENRVDQFQLDLGKPAHQAAYDALLRGNLAPAQALSTSTTVQDGRTTELKGKLGIAYDQLGASVELFRRDAGPNDPAIQGDPVRKAATEALQAQGKDVRWIEKGGAYELGGGHSGSIGTGIGVSYGFEAKKALEWRSMGPRADGQGGAPGLAMTAQDAQAMATGSEFQLRGTANISGKAGVLAGWQAGVPGVKVTAGVGFEVQRGKQVEMNVQVKKLDASTVQVRLDELEKTEKGREFAAKLGAEINGAELAAAGGSILAVLAKKPELAAKLADTKKALSAEFAIGSSKSNSEGKGLTFTLDLSRPEAKAAYEKLVRGNPDAAIQLAARDTSGVALRQSSVTTTRESEKHLNARIGNTELYTSSNVRKDSMVEVVVEGRGERLDSSIAERKQSSIWGRNRQVGVEAVSVRTPEAPNGTKYYRVGYQEKDRFTSAGELQSRRELAASLGAVPARPEVLDPSQKEGRGVVGFITGARNDYGKLQTDIEVFITDAGIATLRGAGRDQALTSYGQVVADKNGGQVPKWADAHYGPWSRNVLDTYRNAKDTGTRDAYRKAYEAQFGTDAFKQDVKEYARASDFANAIGQGSTDGDPAAWNKAFADQAKRAGFNFFDGLAAMNKMAGADQVLVNRFTVKGKAVDIEMVSEGALVAPALSQK